MSKVLSGMIAGVALLGLAACGDTDSTTTQGVDGTTPPPAAAPDTTPPSTTPPPADTGGMGGSTPAQ
ncbi:hypothetical protein GCM10011385_24700 [Nitratireductor aestuarii]|uniref:Uncharacterized protein n=1 Tax=Nitratireductor aestuarii TaxID=1735103 RepID=A0A916W6D1_9HYPH|nr:hypothetical protein [Nitratireductor aestuarii]GGA69925.1 hypothetical protein GCM10011385_24700 [Nitratireductor aestuarii]